MSSAPRLAVDNQNPWPGLSAFDEASERFFNGRANETAELRRLVLNAPLTVLFGASGLGKTSLIQAGLFPSSRRERYLPVYVRLDVRDRAAPLIEQVSSAFQQQKRVHAVEAPAWGENESLWEYLHRPSLELWSKHNQLLTPLFVFDQFEEVLTLGAENASAIRQLRIDLANLIENRIPDVLAKSIRNNGLIAHALALDSQRYKVLLSFREDFLAALEGWKRDVPSILRNRLRLLPMSQEQAFEAIHQTAAHLVNETVGHGIVRFVSAARDDGTTNAAESVTEAGELRVEPALLSLVCHGLNEKRKAQGKTAFDEELLAGNKESIVTEFYQSAVADMPPRVRLFVQDELITRRGFRKPCDVDDAHTKYGVTEQQLRLLVDRRLLRIEPFRGTERVELTHDLLTGVVREQRDREQARARVKRQLRWAVMAVCVMLVLGVPIWWLRHRALEERARFLEREHATEEAHLVDEEKSKDEKNIEKAKEEVLAQQSKIEKRLAEQAIQEEKIADSALTAARAVSRLQDQPDLGLLLAVESARNGDTPDTRGSLLAALQASNLRYFIRDHSKPVNRLAFRENNLISVDLGGTILTHNDHGYPSGQPVVVPGSGLAISPDGTLLVSAGPRTVTLWNADGQKLQELPAVPFTPLAFTLDGRSVAWISQAKSVTLWRVVENRNLDLKVDVVGGATAIALSHDATTLALWSQGAIAVWDIRDVSNPAKLSSLRMDTRGTTVFQFDPTGKFLAIGAPDGRIVFWDMTSTEPRTAIQNWHASSLAFSNDGMLLASGDVTGDIGIWRIGGTGPLWSQRLHSSAVASIAFSADGKTLASSGREEIALSSVTPQSLGRVLPDNGELKGSVAKIASTANGHIVTFGVNAVTNRKGEQTGGEAYIHTWNVSNPSEPALHSWGDAARSAIALTADGSTTASAKFAYDLAPCPMSDIHLTRIDGTDMAKPLRDLETASALAFSPDSRDLVIATCKVPPAESKDSATRYDVVIWNLGRQRNRGKVISTENPITAIAVSPNGNLVAMAVDDEPPRVLLKNLKSEALRPLDLRGGKPLNLRFTPDSENLVSATSDGAIIVSRVHDGKQLAHFATGSSVADLAFSCDGGTMASARNDGSITLWDVEKWQQIGTLRGPRAFGTLSVAFNPADRGMLASSIGNTVILWNIDSATLKKQACRIANRNLSFSEWQQYGEGPYQKTCRDLPVNSSVLQQARVLARQGDRAAAVALFQRVKDLDSSAHLDPRQEVAKEMVAANAQGALARGRRLFKTKPLEALQAFQKAEGLDPSAVIANDWNNVCWQGSLQGFAREMMPACEKAVKLEPSNLDLKDSRGLARALTGDFQGAITDFQAFLDSTRAESLKQQRRDWIKALQASENPFKQPELLKSLQNQ